MSIIMWRYCRYIKLQLCHILMYSVAQIKIPHQTKCNFSTTVWDLSAKISKYPPKQWKVNTVKAICKRVDETGYAVVRKPGSCRQKTVRTSENKNVGEMICSQENWPGTSKSTRKIAEEYWTFIDCLFSELLNVIFMFNNNCSTWSSRLTIV